MMEKIRFGTDGWRDIIADNFNFENVRLVGFSIGKYLLDKTITSNGIFIGYDNRFLSEDFAMQAGYALSSMGIKIYISEESIPTPVTAFMVTDLRLDGAVMITASHNPPKYNGIKFIPNYGGPADSRITKEIENNLYFYLSNEKEIPNLINYEDFLNNINYISNFSTYKKHLFKLIDKDLIEKSDLKIAADTMYGSGSKIMSEILRNELKLEAKLYNNYRDAFFGGKLPDPSENNLKELKEFILSNKYDVGIALDGDADRFGVIDSKGIFISPNNIISLILYYLCTNSNLDYDGFEVVRTVATTHLIDEICKKFNLKLIETPVGFKYIAQEMIKNNVLIGGEESGGLSIYGHIPEKDGIIADLLILEIQSFLKKNMSNISLSEYLDNIYKEFGYFYNERLDIRVPKDKIPFITDYFADFENKKINNVKISEILTKDGVKLILENKSWVLIRASGTEPLIRCYIESRDKNFFYNFRNYIKQIVESLIS